MTEREVVEALPKGSFLRDYVEYAAHRTDAHLGYHVGAGLALLAQTLPIDLTVPFGSKNFGNLYVMLIGDSTESRKTEAVKIAREIMEEALPALLGEAPGSWEGLVEGMRVMPRQILCYNEFSAFLAAAERGPLLPIKAKLTEIYDCVPLGRSTVGGRRLGYAEIKNPRLSVLCAIAQDYLERHTEDADWTGGFMARFMLLFLARQRYFALPPSPDPQWRAKIASHLKGHFDDHASKSMLVRQCSGLTSEASNMWSEWSRRLEDLVHNDAPVATKAPIARAASMVLKMAFLLAWDLQPGARCGDTWWIDRGVIDSATKLIKMHVDSAMTLGDMIARDRDMRDLRRVLSVIRAEPISFGEILKKAQVTKRRGRELIETLLEERVIVRVASDVGEWFALNSGS